MHRNSCPIRVASDCITTGNDFTKSLHSLLRLKLETQLIIQNKRLKSLIILPANIVKFVILNTLGFTNTVRFSREMEYIASESIHLILGNSVNFLDYCCLGNSLS